MSTAQITSRELANAIRFLAIDAVEKSKSGHPGAPMGMADIAEVLWRHHLNHNPADPHWINRDRFVLSNGHGSMLIYALLHLTGYAVSIEDIKNFRQLHSITAGHPEVNITPGVETTTGPLGQGLANAVGMALAESLLAKRFNRPGHTIIDHHTYTFLGDGCLMEGISHEVCSLAGVWGLNKLICFYDDNGISIDGHVDGWFKDDTASRFKAYGWNVIGPIDGHDAQAVNAATTAAQSETAKPTLIICKTTIGLGAPNMAGTHDVHGAPLGEKEAAATREALGWKYGPFEVPAPIKTAWDAVESGKAKQAQWNEQLAKYQAAFPELAKELMRCATEKLPATWSSTKTQLFASMKAIESPTASRKSSQQTLDILVPALPELLGGSADLTGSNLTAAKTSITWHHKTDQAANYISYGVREFGMSAIMNGVALHKGFIPYGGTFAVFSDYARNAIRMSALMKQRVIYVLTHDSIGLGEDGPTHQPIEHAASLRLIPHLDLWRPCDGFETAIAWTAAIQRTDGPSALFLSRQNLPQLSKNISEADVMRGGYVLSDCEDKPDAVLIATGSEVGLAMQAQEILRTQGKSVSVVSMPCTSLFDRQDKSWQEKVLPSGIKRIAIEAGHPDPWWKYVGLDGAVVGINRFGESAPAAAVYKALGVTVEHIVELV
ncbi:transketolase [Polynucleobacter sp. UK-FUSCHL-C3]|uniref:Transketolase n=1 Tax=Polynucleobacter sp. UK-FUSCHL-C3 TaxID=2955208 RepID=A0AAU8A540_9BURK